MIHCVSGSDGCPLNWVCAVTFHKETSARGTCIFEITCVCIIWCHGAGTQPVNTSESGFGVATHTLVRALVILCLQQCRWRGCSLRPAPAAGLCTWMSYHLSFTGQVFFLMKVGLINLDSFITVQLEFLFSLTVHCNRCSYWWRRACKEVLGCCVMGLKIADTSRIIA